MSIKRIKPKAGQESVWDYPRPPRLESFNGHIRIVYNSEIILDTQEAYRILETSHPPTYYVPVSQFRKDLLRINQSTSFCEFKGMAAYYDLQVHGKTAKKAAWHYPNPKTKYHALKDHVSVYAHLMDACLVNDELVDAQQGSFYGGWITTNIVGPFKGAPGTWGW
jgi:uncharacterized protein (DUF427 family)